MHCLLLLLAATGLNRSGSSREPIRTLHEEGKCQVLSYCLLHNNLLYTIKIIIMPGITSRHTLNLVFHLIFLQSEELCFYHYAVEQQYFDGDAKQNVTVLADIEISCHSSDHSLHAVVIPA